MTEPQAGASIHDLGAVLETVVGDRCLVGFRSIDAVHVDDLTVAERTIVQQAVEHRRAEFATGRRLLRDLIGADVEILRAASGAPEFPRGLVGSLAHDRGVAVALVGAAEATRAVGIDVEPVHRLDRGVAELVVRHDDVVPDALTAFVAKEAAYKAWSGVGGAMLDHHDVNVVVEGDRYRADLRGELSVTGDLASAAGRLVAIVIIPAT